MTAARPRRTVWWLVAAGGLLLALIASLPWLWARWIEGAVSAEVVRRHGEDYAIIGMHIDGDDGESLNLYRKLWRHVVNRLATGEKRWDPDRDGNYLHHHLSLLVSDNLKTYHYHWSLRQGRLVLTGVTRVNAMALERPWSDYLYTEADVEWRRGLRWKRNLDDHEIAWYHPSWELRPDSGKGVTGGGQSEWDPMPRLPRDH